MPFGGLGDLEEPLEAGDGRLMQRAGAFGLTVGILIGQSRFEVREMLYVAQRHLAVVALGIEGGDEVFPGMFELPDPAVRHANRELHIRLLQPFGRAVLHQLIEFADRQVGSAEARAAVRAAANVAHRLDELGDVHPFPLGRRPAGTVGVEPIVRVTVGLVRAPGVAVGKLVVRVFAGRLECIAERIAVEHPAVERLGEEFGGGIFDGPAGGDDRAHAHRDQFAGHAGGQAIELDAVGACGLGSGLADVAAVENTNSGTCCICSTSTAVRKTPLSSTIPLRAFPFAVVGGS